MTPFPFRNASKFKVGNVILPWQVTLEECGNGRSDLQEGSFQLRNHGKSLRDESLRYLTLLVEVEGIVNSRPITCESIGDVNSIIPLSPMQLLSSKTRVVMPPPGTFQKEDMYCRKQWRRVQHLSNKFWTRWRKEVFATLQTTQKWNQTKRNLEMPQAT